VKDWNPGQHGGKKKGDVWNGPIREREIGTMDSGEVRNREKSAGMDQ
jgi:hypothetical protein